MVRIRPKDPNRGGPPLPVDAQPPAADGRPCTSRRSVTVTVPRGQRAVRATVDGRRVRIGRSNRRVTISLAGRPAGRVTVRVTTKTRSGKLRTVARRYRTCVPRRR